MDRKYREELPGDTFDGGCHLSAQEQHRQRAAKNPDQIAYAIEPFEAHGIEYTLKNPQTGHFRCRRKSDDRLFLFYDGTGKHLQDALEACDKAGLRFDAVNESLPERKDPFDSEARKIGASEYWDDKAVNLRQPGAEKKPEVSRKSILHDAERCVCGDRDMQYGSPENSLTVIADLWRAYLKGIGCVFPTGENLAAKDAAAMMVLFKMARVATGAGKADNWVDAAGYAACGGEIEGGEAK